MKKALMIASMGSMLDNFNRNNIDLLLSMGYSVTLAANFNTDEDSSPRQRIEQFEKDMIERGCRIEQIDFSRKLSSIIKQNHSYKQIKKLVRQKYDLVHCHSPICAVLTRFAFRTERKKGTRIIYTAHGFHFYKGAPLKNWLLYFPAEWICSHWTDVLLVINKEDYRLARRHMKCSQTVYIPGVGIDFNRFSLDFIDRDKRSALRHSMGISDKDKMLLSVGELNHNKNHEVVIRAIAQLRNSSLHYVIAGDGTLYDYLIELAGSLGVGDRLHLLGFRNDIEELYMCADLYIHPSRREGLSVALMEAIASKIPVICSDIRGNTDIIGKQALFPSNDVDALAKKINTYICTTHDKEILENYERLKKFDIIAIYPEMEKLYAGGGGSDGAF